MRTIKDLDDAGMDLRCWCYRCQRAAVLDSVVWVAMVQRGFSIDLIDARRHFRCKRCNRTDEILLVSATREPEKDWSAQVEQWFFAKKSKRLFTVKR